MIFPRSSSLLRYFTCVIIITITIAISFLVLVDARIATDVAFGDSLPLFASFRIGSNIKTHRRPMARKFHPVVGVHRVITVPNFHNLAVEDAKVAAAAALSIDDVPAASEDLTAVSNINNRNNNNNKEPLEELLARSEGLYDARHVSAMFHVGRMGARTPWLSVVRQPIQKASPQSQAKVAFLGGRLFGRDPNIAEAAEKALPNKQEFLEEVQIYFDTVPSPEGLATSSVTKMTFMTRYSPKPVNLTMEYIWREQRSYNPEMAISVAGVVAIICVSVLSVVMFSGRDALKRELVVKIRDE